MYIYIFFISGSEDGTVRVWNLRLGTSLSSFALDSPVYQVFKNISFYDSVEMDETTFNGISL